VVSRIPSADSVTHALVQALGYLNLSTGTPDPAFQLNLNTLGLALEAERALETHANAESRPLWRRIEQRLKDKLAEVRGNSAALRETDQVDNVLRLVFAELLPAYLKHHADLLFHQREDVLFNALFLARAFEAVLAQQGPWDEHDRIIHESLNQLNDFLGHRPVAVLHNDRKTEPYRHERVRPVPLYLRGVGPAHGAYHEIIHETLDLLKRTDPELLDEAYFEYDLLDELALDPRAYDFGHPVNRRPNYQFGEWDPHFIDNQGRYRRFVIRQVTLDALMDRVHRPGDLPREEVLREAAAVLAGVILMSSGTSGRGPDTHDSSVTLSNLLTRIASYRDRFYTKWLTQFPASHQERLKNECERAKQPFGGARQHLNRFLARLRAAQLQHIELSKLFAEMGYPGASQRQARIVPVARGRMLSEISSRVTTCHHLLDSGHLCEAAKLLPEMEDLLHRAIGCGAFVDPWNILAFQGQFSIFVALENSVHDQRVDELIDLVENLFTLYIRLSSEAAATGRDDLGKTLSSGLTKQARWWDQFATNEISGVRNVSGRESLESAKHVASALGAWHKAGAAAGDVAFWRAHVEKFTSAKSYSLVIEALLEKQDHVASMALLLQWLSQVDHVPLQEGRFSFHALAVRWMQAANTALAEERVPAVEHESLVCKFFDFLEANAETYWEVPRLDTSFRGSLDELTKRTAGGEDSDDWSSEDGPDGEEELSDDADNPFGAAYENMVYRDSTADGHDSETLSGGEGSQLTDDELVAQSEEISMRLRFLTTLATLWRTSVAQRLPSLGSAPQGEGPAWHEAVRGWLTRSRHNQAALMNLLESLHRRPLPQPPASPAAMVEYDRMRRIKDALASEVLLAYVATGRAAMGLLAALPEFSMANESQAKLGSPEAELPNWQRRVVDLQRRIVAGNVAEVRAALPGVIEALVEQPLLYVPMAKRGDPKRVAAAQILQQVLRDLLRALPRLGCLRETFHLIETARSMEKQMPAEPGAVSEFDRLFQIGFQAIVEHLVLSAETWARSAPADSPTAEEDTDGDLIEALHAISESLMRQWRSHSQSLRLSVLEKISDDASWQKLAEFIRNYGSDLFGPRFLNQGNLRSILHQGVGAYLESLAEANETEGSQLLSELEIGKLDKTEAANKLELILESIVENYAEYKDFNSTTTQSDSGENLYMLLDFLRLKASYERLVWHLKPVVLAHEVLVRKGRDTVAVRWRQVLSENTAQAAAWHMKRLDQLQKTHGIQLPTVADRLGERLVRPLALDRIRALVRPAVDEAKLGETSPAFEALEREIVDFSEQPTGVGLDVPQWLVALDDEVQQARSPMHIDSLATDWLPRVPILTLSREELQQQIDTWEEPLTGK